MSAEVILPKLTTTMDEGTIAGWLKQEGDLVQAGQPLFELEGISGFIEKPFDLANLQGKVEHVLRIR